MPTIVALDNEYCTVRVDTDKRTVSHTFKKYIYGESFREALSAGAELMEKYRATKWLSDDRNNSALPKPDQEWAATVWAPRVRKAGWKHWAVVLPKMVIGQMNVQGFVERSKKEGVDTRMFDDPGEAKAWLESV